MTITTHQIKTYTIDDHPNKEAVYDWIRDNWHDLGEHDVEEFVDSFKALADSLSYKGYSVKADYSVSIHPDRSEFLRLYSPEYGTIPIDELDLSELNEDDCPLTGVCWDHDVIEAAKNGNMSEALAALHKQGEWIYSDEGIHEHIEANEYEFTEKGEFYI